DADEQERHRTARVDLELVAPEPEGTAGEDEPLARRLHHVIRGEDQEDAREHQRGNPTLPWVHLAERPQQPIDERRPRGELAVLGHTAGECNGGAAIASARTALEPAGRAFLGPAAGPSGAATGACDGGGSRGGACAPRSREGCRRS